MIYALLQYLFYTKKLRARSAPVVDSSDSSDDEEKLKNTN